SAQAKTHARNPALAEEQPVELAMNSLNLELSLAADMHSTGASRGNGGMNGRPIPSFRICQCSLNDDASRRLGFALNLRKPLCLLCWLLFLLHPSRLRTAAGNGGRFRRRGECR